MRVGPSTWKSMSLTMQDKASTDALLHYESHLYFAIQQSTNSHVGLAFSYQVLDTRSAALPVSVEASGV